jgi:hypothetical protein
MRFRFVVDGAAYSKQKETFKDILRRHTLSFKGSRDTFVWSNRQESVTATYERDEAKDLTIKADLVWQSRKKTPLLNALKEWVWSVGGVGGEEEDAAADAGTTDAIDRELAVWDAVHRPDEERLRKEGRPEAWIVRDVRDWKRKRTEKRRELTARFGPR